MCHFCAPRRTLEVLRIRAAVPTPHARCAKKRKYAILRANTRIVAHDSLRCFQNQGCANPPVFQVRDHRLASTRLRTSFARQPPSVRRRMVTEHTKTVNAARRRGRHISHCTEVVACSRDIVWGKAHPQKRPYADASIRLGVWARQRRARCALPAGILAVAVPLGCPQPPCYWPAPVAA